MLALVARKWRSGHDRGSRATARLTWPQLQPQWGLRRCYNLPALRRPSTYGLVRRPSHFDRPTTPSTHGEALAHQDAARQGACTLAQRHAALCPSFWPALRTADRLCLSSGVVQWKRPCSRHEPTDATVITMITFDSRSRRGASASSRVQVYHGPRGALNCIVRK